MSSNLRFLFLLFVAVFCVSCAGKSSYMRPTQNLLSPPEDKALVRIMRPSGFGSAVNFNILDGEKVIGNSVAKSQFDYLAEPGKHLFIATAENKAFLEAELEEGKTYYILTQVKMGVWKARVGLIAVNKDSEFWNQVLEYECTLQMLEPDTDALKAWEDHNKAKIKKVLDMYESEWKNNPEVPVLRPEDGR